MTDLFVILKPKIGEEVSGFEWFQANIRVFIPEMIGTKSGKDVTGS
ncbi:MAG TPA: hypothetical protein VFH95_16450 [Candidatus Kapabacteria bacterium]|nr:hypothetical protein [Candidatus Kapabacteria bacterium]